MTDTKRTEQEPEMDEWLLACRTLEAAGVPYVIVGAFGAELHFLRTAVQISTHDMDVLLPMSWQQVLSALEALGKAGFTFSVGDEGLIPDDVQAQGIVRNCATVKAERGEHSVDLLTELPGHRFEELWERQSEYVLKGVPVRVAPLDAIIQSKHQAGRMKDRLFLEQFREVIEEAFDREAKRPKPPPPC
jgi:hypothetical protein